MPEAQALKALGRDTFGPILAEFALRLWTYSRAVPDPDEARLLFCARGGLRLRLFYEAFLERTGLAAPLRTADFMVSRIVAARGAVLNRSRAAAEEIAREFAGASAGDVAAALAGGRDLVEGAALPHAGRLRPFDVEDLDRLIHREDGSLTALGEAVRGQDLLFKEHVGAAAGARRLVICDTGLYGRTLRMLLDGAPDYAWTCVLFARSNYKGFAAEHFGRVCGLSVERDGYDPFDPRTAALRYWQVVEAMLEPPLPSVKRFRRGGVVVVSNLEVEGWRGLVAPQGDGDALFAGALAHLAALGPEAVAETVYRDAAAAWRRLHRIVTWPTPAEARLLMVGARSRDFGRSDTVDGRSTPTRRHPRAAIAALRGSLWREGAAALAFPLARPLLLAGLQGYHLMRFARRRGRRG